MRSRVRCEVFEYCNRAAFQKKKKKTPQADQRSIANICNASVS